jgi:hypothetical protein
MAEINIYTAETESSVDSGEAIGFFGDDGFGDPIALNTYNGRTFLTTANGDTEYEECDNCKLTVTGSWSGITGVSGVIVGQVGSGVSLRSLPNYLATINVRFTHAEEVIVQNAQLTVYGDDLDTRPSGLRFFAAEIIHTSRLQEETGSGDEVWEEMDASNNVLPLVDSPATSGFSPLGPGSLDTRHDWYVAMSITPTLPGDKSFGMQIDLEYI